MSIMLDVSRRKSATMVASDSPEDAPGKAVSFSLSEGVYEVTSQVPFYLEVSGMPSISSYYASAALPLILDWKGGEIFLANASGQTGLVHVVPGRAA